MKLNKWTVALAAVGVVSLASAAKAEEKASTVMTALSSTTLSGYVDTSAQWNFGTGNANVPPYRFNSPNKADGFNLDVVQVRIEKPLDETEWAAGYRVDLWAGPDANNFIGGVRGLGTQSSGIGVSDFAIRQAYVALRTPVGNGIDWKVGVFDSVIGYESVESPNNPNYTRSYGNSIEPTTHTGILGTYRFCDMFSASAGVADTTGPVINSRDTIESRKTYMGSVAITAPESLGFLAGSTLYGGAVNGFNADTVVNGVPAQNYYAGATLATPVTGLRVGASWDLLNVKTDGVRGNEWSVAGYVSYQMTEKLSFHGRFENFRGDVDAGALVFNPTVPTVAGTDPDNSIYATTVTAQYDLWKNVISRLEFRWDHMEHGLGFGGTTTGDFTRKNAYLLAANIIYKF